MSAVPLSVCASGFVAYRARASDARRGKTSARASERDVEGVPSHVDDSARSRAPKTTRRPLIVLPVAMATAATRATANASEFASEEAMAVLERRGKIAYSDEEWQQRLDPFTYKVLRKEATERPFSSELNKEKRVGRFVCAGCGSPLFDSKTKYDSGTGWPSFYEPLAGAVTEVPDFSIMFLPRTEVRCKTCQGHLGHVFEDGPPPTGLRYCMNGAAMKFEPEA